MGLGLERSRPEKKSGAQMRVHPLLAVIPARGGSKGLPGKNIRPLAGLPLTVHSILFSKLCPGIDRCVVSTDSEEIAEVARAYGAEVPFLRPCELARDETPSLVVVQHALSEMEAREGRRFESVLLLQPTSPARLPEDVSQAISMLEQDPRSVGVVAASVAEFNPRSVCVEEREGYMMRAFDQDKVYTRRQEVPPVYRINGVLYLWRRDHLLHASKEELFDGPHRMLIIPRERAIDIDDLYDFQLAEVLVREGIVNLAWLNTANAANQLKQGILHK
jgi:CMP-N-acetylneuraminic acid synthetase